MISSQKQNNRIISTNDQINIYKHESEMHFQSKYLCILNQLV
jgi:hypothetical protein